MQIAGKPQRVKLKVDLTRYDSNCKIGELGYTMPDIKLSMWGSQDRFVAVRFDNGARLDVLLDSLDVIIAKKKKEKDINSREGLSYS